MNDVLDTTEKRKNLVCIRLDTLTAVTRGVFLDTSPDVAHMLEGS